jgi:hypothetical protein
MILKRACKDEFCTQGHENPNVKQISKVHAGPIWHYGHIIAGSKLKTQYETAALLLCVKLITLIYPG